MITHVTCPAGTGLLILAVLLGGCEMSSGPTAGTDPAQPVTPPSATASVAGSADGYWQSRFDAISTTAMSIGGNLTVSDAPDGIRSFVFEQAGRYDSSLSVHSLGLDAWSRAESGTWADLLNVPMDGVVDLRKVISQSVPANAANGGLCGGVPATWLAIARRPESEGKDTLLLAAFSSADAPSADRDESGLCGTFTYAPQ